TARPRSRFVADLAGVNLLRGRGRGRQVELDSGAMLTAAEAGEGDVFAVIHPRAVALYLARPEGTPRNVWRGRAEDLDLQDKRLAAFGRFHQRVVRPRTRGGLPHWSEDSRFDIANHVSHLALPAPGNEKALRELVSELMSTPLDFSKPLWHVHLVDGYGGNSV